MGYVANKIFQHRQRICVNPDSAKLISRADIPADFNKKPVYIIGGGPSLIGLKYVHISD